MVSAGCDQLLNQIHSHFGYLFERYEFAVIHVEDSDGGNRCLVVLEAQDCRIRFHTCLGHSNVMFGPRTAPLSWEDVRQGKRYWYYAGELLDYIQRKRVDVEEILAEVRTQRSPEERLADLSRRLEPACGVVISLFRPGTYGKWEADYEGHKEQRAAEFNDQVRAWEASRRTERESGIATPPAR